MPSPQKIPSSLRFARFICQRLPPVLGFRPGRFLYPRTIAENDTHVYEVRGCTGSLFRSTTRDIHGYYFILFGYFEWRNLAIALALCKPGDTIIEIGANIGTETLGFRDIVGTEGRVVCFEPAPGNALALQRLTALNGWKNVEVRRQAVAARSGVVDFALPPEDSANTGIGHIALSDERVRGPVVKVECTTLDLLADEIGAARIVFIDAEGSDADIVAGGLQYIKAYRPSIVVECGQSLLARSGWTVKAFHELLRSQGYNLYRISRYGCVPVENPDLGSRINLVCLHNSLPGAAKLVSHSIRKCAFLPRIRGLNPLKGVLRR